jgi:hypothetical protein
MHSRERLLKDFKQLPGLPYDGVLVQFNLCHQLFDYPNLRIRIKK